MKKKRAKNGAPSQASATAAPRVVKLPEGSDLDAFAREQFGENAYVPLSRWDSRDAPVLGYIVSPTDGTYAVVDRGDGEP